jgi:uncharacterized repeat protein (TIGR03803 family)
MKIKTNQCGLLLAILVALMIAGTINYSYAQTYSVLVNFNFNSGGGNFPSAGLASENGVLYGTTPAGGSNGNGTVFSINADGSGFRVLKKFLSWSSDFSQDPAVPTNSTGGSCRSPVVVSNGVLYGVTTTMGMFGWGVVFKVNTNGSGFTVLKNFPRSDGTNTFVAEPNGGLLLSGNTLYGGGLGGLFKINTDGSGYSEFFHPTNANFGGGLAGSDGDLTLSGNTLYGTATVGFGGIVFKVDTDGNNSTLLCQNFTPNSGLILSGASLFGIGRTNGYPSFIFKVNTDGSGFSTLKTFDDNSEGAPQGKLLLVGSSLYGTTQGGVGGVLFKINTDGTAYTVLKNFDMVIEGESANGGLIYVGGNLYGTTYAGGTNDAGTVFSLTLPASVPVIQNAVRENSDLRIYWQGQAGSNYVVQASTNLSLVNSFQDISSVVSLLGSGVVGTNYLDVGALTNFPTRFYRIRSN